MEVNGAPKQPGYKLSSKYLPLCSAEQRNSCMFGTTWGWVNDDRIFIFGWTIPLNLLISPGWATRWCFISEKERENLRSHSVQWYGLSSVWWVRWCFLRFTAWLKYFPHWEHWYGFSPVWTRRWIRSFACLWNLFPQWLHWCGLFSSHACWWAANSSSWRGFSVSMPGRRKLHNVVHKVWFWTSFEISGIWYSGRNYECNGKVFVIIRLTLYSRMCRVVRELRWRRWSSLSLLLLTLGNVFIRCITLNIIYKFQRVRFTNVLKCVGL